MCFLLSFWLWVLQRARRNHIHVTGNKAEQGSGKWLSEKRGGRGVQIPRFKPPFLEIINRGNLNDGSRKRILLFDNPQQKTQFSLPAMILTLEHRLRLSFRPGHVETVKHLRLLLLLGRPHFFDKTNAVLRNIWGLKSPARSSSSSSRTSEKQFTNRRNKSTPKRRWFGLLYNFLAAGDINWRYCIVRWFAI